VVEANSTPEMPSGWTLLATHPNPWGVVPTTAGGRCTPEYVTRYMDRVAAEAARRNCRSRQHHYVPKAYLRRWTEHDGMLRRIDTGTGELERRHPTATCRLRHFYQVTGPEGRGHNQVEQILSVLDTELARLLASLVSLAPDDDVSFDQFVTLGLCMAVQHLRTPQFRRLRTARVDWIQQQYAQAADPRLGVEYALRFAPAVELLVNAMFEQMWPMADELTLREIHIFEDPQRRIPTSDAPVLFEPPSREVRGNPGLIDHPRIWWPISPGRAICLDRDTVGRKTQFHRITGRERALLQRLIVHGREQFLIAAPGSDELPVAVLPRRPQLEVSCEPLDDGSCRVGFGETYANAPVDRSCSRHKRILRSDMHA